MEASHEILRKRFQDFITQEGQAKLNWVVDAKVSWYMYRSIFHFIADPHASSLTYDHELGEFSLRYPLIRRMVNLACSTVLSQPYEFTVTPASDTRDDYLVAQAKSLVLKDFDARNPSAVDDLAVMIDAINLGVAFRRVYADIDWVASLVSEEQAIGYEQAGGVLRSVEKVGEDQFRVVTPRNVVKQAYIPGFQVICPTGARSLKDCDRFVIHEQMSVDKVRELYGYDPRAETILDRHTTGMNDSVGGFGTTMGGRTLSNQTGVSIGPESGRVRVYDCWEKQGPYWINVILVGEHDMRVVAMKTTYDHPLVEITAPRTDTFWPYGFTHDAQDPQRALCHSYRNLHRSFDENLKTVVIMENSVKDNLDNSFSQVLRINRQTTNPPQILQMPQGVHRSCIEMMQISENAIYNTFGMSEASRGVTKSHVAASALEMARDTDTGPLTFLRKSLEESCVELRKKVLMVAEQNGIYDIPTLLTMTTPNNAGIFGRIISTGDLAGLSNIRIENVVNWPTSIVDRIDIASKMVQVGLFTPGNEAVNERFKEFIGVQRGMIPQPVIELRNEERATLEGQMAKQGMLSQLPQFDQESGQVMPGPVVDQNMLPILDDLDIDAIHVRNHQLDYAELPHNSPGAIILAAHIREHEERMQQAQFAAEEQRIEMITRESAANQAPQVEMSKMAAEQRTQMEEMKADVNTKLKTFEISVRSALESRKIQVNELKALDESMKNEKGSEE